MKLIIMGHGGHGKDYVAELFTPMTFISSSWAAAERVVYPELRDLYNYQTVEQCHTDRRHHRTEWFNLIRAYNNPDPTKLAREIYAEFDIYVGVRNPDEFLAIKESRLFEWSIWVDASQRKEPELTSSNGLCADDADFVLDNNGTKAELRARVASLREVLSC